LEDYSKIFAENHINGKNILEIGDQELKEDLNMQSLGHRKIF
jgi:hypothetical protein